MFELIKPFLTAEYVAKLTRQGVISMSTALVTNGVVTMDQQQQFAGALGVVASVIWVAIAHYQATAKADAKAVGGLA
jgi:hypothetical protein